MSAIDELRRRRRQESGEADAAPSAPAGDAQATDEAPASSAAAELQRRRRAAAQGGTESGTERETDGLLLTPSAAADARRAVSSAARGAALPYQSDAKTVERTLDVNDPRFADSDVHRAITSELEERGREYVQANPSTAWRDTSAVKYLGKGAQNAINIVGKYANGVVSLPSDLIGGLNTAVNDIFKGGSYSEAYKRINESLDRNPTLRSQLIDEQAMYGFSNPTELYRQIADTAGVTIEQVKAYALANASTLRNAYWDSITPGAGKAAQFGGQVAYSIGQQVPLMLFGAFAGGGGGGDGGVIGNLINGDGVKAIKSALQYNPQTLAMGIQAAASKYTQNAGEYGNTGARNFANAAASGFIEYFTENLFGFSDIGSIQRMFTPKVGTGFLKNFGRFALDYLVNGVLEEGLEEVAAEPLEGLVDKLTVNPGRKWFGDGGVFDVRAMAEAGLSGAVSGAIMSGAGMAFNVVNEAVVERAVRADMAELRSINDSLPEGVRLSDRELAFGSADDLVRIEDAIRLRDAFEQLHRINDTLPDAVRTERVPVDEYSHERLQVYLVQILDALAASPEYGGPEIRMDKTPDAAPADAAEQAAAEQAPVEVPASPAPAAPVDQIAEADRELSRVLDGDPVGDDALSEAIRDSEQEIRQETARQEETAAETQPTEAQPAEQQPVEQQPAEQQPAETPEEAQRAPEDITAPDERDNPSGPAEEPEAANEAPAQPSDVTAEAPAQTTEVPAADARTEFWMRQELSHRNSLEIDGWNLEVQYRPGANSYNSRIRRWNDASNKFSVIWTSSAFPDDSGRGKAIDALVHKAKLLKLIDSNADEAPAPSAPKETPAPEAPAKTPAPAVPATRDAGEASARVADEINERFFQKGRFNLNSAVLFEICDKAFGGTRAEGKYTPKDAYDALELAVNRYLLDRVQSFNVKDVSKVAYCVNELSGMLNQLPTQTSRTEDQVRLQQFSTPPTIAYLAAWAANVTPADVVLEPSAGIGGLALFPKAWGAKVAVNEIDPRRASVIRQMGFDSLTTEDGLYIDNNRKLDHVQPSLVIMNPPFSSTSGKAKSTNNSFAHVEAALGKLSDGGRLVAILGAGIDMDGTGRDSAGYTRWITSLKQSYTVAADFRIDGRNYRKYGTDFNVRILVVDKIGPQAGMPVRTGQYTSLTDDDLLGQLWRVRNERKQAEGSLSEQSVQRAGTRNGQDRTPRAPESGRRNDTAAPVGREQGVGGNDAAAPVTAGNGGSDRGARPAAAGERDIPGGGNEPVRRAGNEQGDVLPDSGRDGGPGGVPDRGAERVGGAAEAAAVVAEAPADRGAAGAADSRLGKRADSAGEGLTAQDTEKPRVMTAAERKKELKARRESGSYISYVSPALPAGADTGIRHPADLVESIGMSSVDLPAATYKPHPQLNKLPGARLKLSTEQMVNVVYAGQAHEVMLPDGRRQGYLIGDGTGVGKGLQISGIIMDQWLRGKHKAIWISEKRTLHVDAQRDWGDLGGQKDDVLLFDRSKKKVLDAKEGVMFSTYSTLRTSPTKGQKSNLDLISEWAGADFDGVIVFDEAHNMGNLDGRNASAQAKAGVELQKRFPKARVVYASATAATEVGNILYADRLGLWGPGSSFNSASDFASAISESGTSAMELVARDLKAAGLYNSRSISYEGVEYTRLDHKLTPAQVKMYDTMCDGWGVVMKNLEQVLQLTNQGKNGQARGQARSALFSAMQQFYNQVLCSLAMPSVIEQMHADLDAGKSVVLQIVNTNESRQNAITAKARETGETLEELDFSPRSILTNYLEKAFPIYQYDEQEDADGHVTSVLVKDSDGNPLINKRAVALRDELIDDINHMMIPDNPLDLLFKEFGVDAVSEVTGRSSRIVPVRGQDGSFSLVEQSRGNVNTAKEADTQAFQDGNTRILIFSDAGGTGKSYHADRRAKNQTQRVHYVLQPGWNAAKAVQGFGRTNRSNQVSKPIYRLVTTNVAGQARFISTIARRLDSLGAMTKGQRQAGSSGMFSAADNLESALATDTLVNFWRALDAGRFAGFTGREVADKMGLSPYVYTQDGKLNVDSDKLRDVSLFLNRLLMVPLSEQNELMNIYRSMLTSATEMAEQAGTLDTGIETVKADRIEVADENTLTVDERTGAETKFLKVKTYNKPQIEEDVHAFQKMRGFVGVYANTKGNARAIVQVQPATLPSGEVVNRYARYSPNKRVKEFILQDQLDRMTKIEERHWQARWDEAIEKIPEFIERTEYYLTGALLPVWRDFGRDRIRAQRLILDDGRQILGVQVSKDVMDQLGRKYNVTVKRDTVTPQAVLDGLMKRQVFTAVGGGVTLRMVKVGGESRIEVDTYRNYLDGIMSEKVNGVWRKFIPVGEDGLKILERWRSNNGITFVRDNPDGISDKRSVRGTPQTMKEWQADAGNFRSINMMQNDSGNTVVKTADVVMEDAEQTLGEISNFVQHSFGVTIKIGRLHRSGILGQHDNQTSAIRLSVANELPTLTHELGHYFDAKYGLDNKNPGLFVQFLSQEMRDSYSQQLWNSEGLAEFLKLYLADKSKMIALYGEGGSALEPGAASPVEAFLEELRAAGKSGQADLENLDKLAGMVFTYQTGHVMHNVTRMQHGDVAELRADIERYGFQKALQIHYGNEAARRAPAGQWFDHFIQRHVDFRNPLLTIARQTDSHDAYAYELAGQMEYTTDVAENMIRAGLTDTDGNPVVSTKDIREYNRVRDRLMLDIAEEAEEGGEIRALSEEEIWDALPDLELSCTVSRKGKDFVITSLGDVVQFFKSDDTLKRIDEAAYNDFSNYLVARHAGERMAQEKRVYANDNVTPEVIDSWLRKWEKDHPEYREMGEFLDRWRMAFMMEYGVGSGLIDRETAVLWNDMYPHHVPLMRWFDESNSIYHNMNHHGVGSPYKRAVGSGRDIVNVVDSLMQDVFVTLNAARRNRLFRAMAATVLETDESSRFMEMIPFTKERQAVRTDRMVKSLDRRITSALRGEGDETPASMLTKTLYNRDQKAGDAVIDSIVGLINDSIPDELVKYVTKKQASGSQILIYVNGEPQLWEIHDGELFNFVSSVMENGSHAFGKAFGKLTREIQANLTGRNPVWNASNAARDLQTVWYKWITDVKSPKAFAARVMHLLPDIVRSWRTTIADQFGGQTDSVHAQYMAMGGQRSSVYSANDRQTAVKVRKSLVSKWYDLANIPSWFSFIGEMIERGPREAVFRQAMREGASSLTAKRLADEVTTDFRMTGGSDAAKTINNHIPFFKAAIAGSAQLLRNYTGFSIDPKTHRLATGSERAKIAGRRLSWLMGTGLVLAAIYRLMSHAHEDDYSRLSEYTKNNYWCIWIGNNQFITLPKPREYGVMESFFERCFVEWQDSDGSGYTEFMSYASDLLLPPLISDVVGDAANKVISQVQGKDYETSGVGLIGDVSIIGPVMEVIANKDYLGRPIVSAANQYKRAKDQYTGSNSWAAVTLGNALNLSPAQIDHVASGTLGVFWDVGQDFFPADASRRDWTGGVKNKFVRSSVYSTDIVNRLYDQAEEAAKNAGSSGSSYDKTVSSMYERQKSIYSTFNKLARADGTPDAVRVRVLDDINSFCKAVTTGSMASEARAVMDFSAKVGNTSILPSALDAEIKYGSGKVRKLNASEYYEYQASYNKSYYAYASRVLAMRSVSDEDKVYMMSLVRDQAKADAAAAYVPSSFAPVTRYTSSASGTSPKAAGVPFQIYCRAAAFARSATADKTPSGSVVPGSKKEKVQAFISGLGLSKAQQAALLDALL